VLRQASEQAALGQLPVTGYCHLDLGDLLREWHDLAAASRHLEAGIERIERAGSPTILLDGYIALARLKQALEDGEGTLRAFRHAQSLVRNHDLPSRFVARLAAHEARSWLAQGNLEAATRWAQDRELDLGELSYLREAEHLTMARVFIAQDKLVEARQLLDRLLTAAEDGGRMKSTIEILILQALTSQAQGDQARALGALESALELAQPEGYVSTFVDEGAAVADLLAHARGAHSERLGTAPDSSHSAGYVGKLLAAFRERSAPWHLPPEVLPSNDLLSDRELEVLQLVAAGFKNQQIAEELFVVVGTVKAHLNSIYRKLGVQSRIQAVSRAKALGLLDGKG
jgi:LuxR family maltose regulon positive regulatory protein